MITWRNLKIVLTALAVLALPIAPGCSGGAEQTRTTVTRTTNPPRYASAESEPVDTANQPTTTTTTTTTESDRPDSVLGATVHAVATVVTLPFRVVGDTLEMIF
jgi:hypothetical protein